MRQVEHTLRTLEENGNDIDTDTERFVGMCKAPGDLVTDKVDGNLSVICPVTRRTINVSYGICRETSKSCEHHA